MSALKDMADLVASLRKKVKDRELAEDWLRFHDLLQDVRNENDALSERIHALELENVELRTRLENAPTAVSSENLPDEALAMLKLIARHPDELFEDDIYRRLGLDKTHGQYYFEKLSEAGLATVGMGVMNQGIMLDLTEAGRAYVVEKRLLAD
jgi:regulator of replication initiation timing